MWAAIRNMSSLCQRCRTQYSGVVGAACYLYSPCVPHIFLYQKLNSKEMISLINYYKELGLCTHMKLTYPPKTAKAV